MSSTRGRGRLVWTDGYRAAILTDPNVWQLVDLADVLLDGMKG